MSLENHVVLERRAQKKKNPHSDGGMYICQKDTTERASNGQK